jgi:hypothetical protein
MDTNAEKLLFRDEVFQIVGCAIKVLNALGHGIVEKAIRKCVGRGGHGGWEPCKSPSGEGSGDSNSMGRCPRLM